MHAPLVDAQSASVEQVFEHILPLLPLTDRHLLVAVSEAQTAESVVQSEYFDDAVAPAPAPLSDAPPEPLPPVPVPEVSTAASDPVSAPESVPASLAGGASLALKV